MMMATTDRPVCHHRRVFRGGYPLWALHAVLIAPAIHPLDVIRPVHIRPLGVSRRWQMFVVIGSRPREVALSEVGVYKLHMVSLGAVVVVGLLGEGTGFFLLCSPARFVLLWCHGVQIDLHVPRRGVVFAADMLLFPIIQAHAATPPSFLRVCAVTGLHTGHFNSRMPSGTSLFHGLSLNLLLVYQPIAAPRPQQKFSPAPPETGLASTGKAAPLSRRDRIRSSDCRCLRQDRCEHLFSRRLVETLVHLEPVGAAPQLVGGA